MANLVRHLAAACVLLMLGTGCIEPPDQSSDPTAVDDVGSAPDGGGLDDSGSAADLVALRDAGGDLGARRDAGAVDMTRSEDMRGTPDATARDGGAGVKTAHLVVGDPAALNQSEELIRMFLKSSDIEVRVVDDDLLDLGQATPDVFLVSKTSESPSIADKLRLTTSGVLTWEDRLLVSNRLGLAAENQTTWNSQTQTIFVEETDGPVPGVLSDTVPYYGDVNNITWAPCSTLVPDALVLARDAQGSDHCTHFVLEAGGQLLDGQMVPGRRAFFGLDDDTFAALTPGGRQFFRAMLLWASD